MKDNAIPILAVLEFRPQGRGGLHRERAGLIGKPNLHEDQPLASRPHNRPLSPHLMHYKWGPHMLVSILHRATGDGMAVVGTILLVWWLAALAAGKDSYARFLDLFTGSDGHPNIAGYIVGIGLTWALFQHIMSGIRHLVMDTGALFELKANKRAAALTIVFSVALTALFWLYILGVK